MNESEIRNYLRYEKIAYKLNHDTYLQQVKGRTTALKHFIPCPKALVFTSAMGERPVPVTMIIIPRAALTMCMCHPGVGEKELWELFDITKGIGRDDTR